MQQISIRENNYDALRFFAMIMVIITHVSDHYLIATDYGDSVVFLFEGISHCANPLFLMLTGVFAMEKSGEVEPEKFWKRFLFRMGIPTIIFAIIYWAWDWYVGIITEPIRIWEDIYRGFYQRYPHWYMSMLTSIYFVLPFAARAKNSVSRGTFRKFVSAYFIWAMLSFYLGEAHSAWIIGCALAFFCYVLLGNMLKDISFRKNNKLGIILILLGCTLLVFDYYVLYLHVQKTGVPSEYYNQLLWGYHAPLVVISIIMIFIGFSILTVRHSFGKIAKYSFYVYLSHELILNILYYFKTIPDAVEELLGGNYGLIIVVMTALVFIMSYIVAIFLNRIQTRIQRSRKAT